MPRETERRQTHQSSEGERQLSPTKKISLTPKEFLEMIQDGLEESGSLTKEELDKESIKRILSAEGITDVVTRFEERLKAERGEPYVYGITTDGLMITVKEGATEDAFAPGYFNAWVLDASLPADRIEQEMIQTEFSYSQVDRLRNGTTDFPSYMQRQFFKENAGKTNDEIKAAYSDQSAVSLLRFYKKTGGFHVPSPTSPNKLPTAGNHILYPVK